jgi:GxxExxY protein
MSADEKRSTDEKQKSVTFRGLHSETSEKVIGVFFDVYNELGGGFLESVYQEALRIALVQAGLRVAIEVPVPVYFRGQAVGNFRADLIVDECVFAGTQGCFDL